MRNDEVERWQRVKAVFLAAVELPEAEQTSFVAAACLGDEELLNEVRALLASAREAGGFAETPVMHLMSAFATSEAAGEPALAPGTRLGAYEITSFISAGGMGHVYRARHIVLGREAAIKTLNTQRADSPARRRLIREAQNAATLDHPNICRIYEVSEADGIPFIAMEFVDGRPLCDLLREGPLPLAEAVHYGQQIADAVEHAHQHGIVHRDLKSSNVVVDRNARPIVLDFGLSKRVLLSDSAAADPTVTAHGTVAGTVSHMAPEVLSGGSADARSDVWSLGVMLFELMTGTLPFQGRTPFETSSAILSDPPRALDRHIPLAVRLVIERCLLKDANQRYQNARDVRDALDAIRRRRSWPLIGPLIVSTRRRTLYATGAVLLLLPFVMLSPRLFESAFAGDRVASVALLPLENATGDPANAYYADGVTDALIAQIGAVADVRVISRGSSARVARTTSARPDVGRQLGADVLVEGRLRRSADLVTVDLRLIESKRGRVLWSGTYQRPASEVLALQSDIVRALAAEIRLTTRADASARLAAARAVDPHAYEAYLKGRYEWNLRTQASLERAITHFTRATELDPTYAPAHAALADCYNQFGTLMVATGSPRVFRPRAAAAAIRALQIDPYSPEAHAALGYVRHYEWQFAEAEREFKRAIELNPSYPLARIWYANLLMSRQRIDEALTQVYAARELDPFSLIINTNVGWVLNASGRYAEAADHLTRTLALDSTYVHARFRLVDALIGDGRPQEAYGHAQRLVEVSRRSPPMLARLAHASAALERWHEVRAVRDELLRRADGGYVPPGTLADVYRLLGHADSTFVWLRRAFDERANYVVYLRVDPAPGTVLQDPRIQQLIAGAGL